MVTTKYLIIGETSVELVTTVSDGDTTLTVNVLPPEPAPPLDEVAAAAAPLLAAPLGEPVAAAPAPTKKRRTLMGVIRAGWFVVFSFVGEALTYALNNITSLNLPPGTATAIGAAGYGVKRALWPNTQL